MALAARLTNLLRRKGEETLAVVLAAADSSPLAGFAAGLRRETEFKHGAWVDEVVMGLLDRDWAALTATAR